MKRGKPYAMLGLSLTPLVTAAVNLKMSSLTLVLGVLLIPNPVTQVFGSFLFGALLINGLTGLFLDFFVFGRPAYLF